MTCNPKPYKHTHWHLWCWNRWANLWIRNRTCVACLWCFGLWCWLWPGPILLWIVCRWVWMHIQSHACIAIWPPTARSRWTPLRMRLSIRQQSNHDDTETWWSMAMCSSWYSKIVTAVTAQQNKWIFDYFVCFIVLSDWFLNSRTYRWNDLIAPFFKTTRLIQFLQFDAIQWKTTTTNRKFIDRFWCEP